MIILKDGIEGRIYGDLMSFKVTELSMYIGSKWFLGSERLASKIGISPKWITQALRGLSVPASIENKIRGTLESL